MQNGSMSLAECQEQSGKEFKQRYPTLESFILTHPIGQDFHFGGFGFERYLDGLNLAMCKYPTCKHAEIARIKAYTRRCKGI